MVTLRALPGEPAAYSNVRLAVEAAGQPIGTAGFVDGVPEWRMATLFVEVADEYVADTVTALCRFGFAQMNLAKVEAVADDATVATYEAAGFVREVHRRRARWVDGAWRDEYLMGLLAGELT